MIANHLTAVYCHVIFLFICCHAGGKPRLHTLILLTAMDIMPVWTILNETDLLPNPKSRFLLHTQHTSYMFYWKIVYLRTMLCFWSSFQIRTAQRLCNFNDNHSQDIQMIGIFIVITDVYTNIHVHEKAQELWSEGECALNLELHSEG